MSIFLSPTSSQASTSTPPELADSGFHPERSRSAKRDVLEQKNELGPKLVVVMVGLPARGKSYICKKLCRYLSWLGFNTKVFNVGNLRRVLAKEEAQDPHLKPYVTQHDAKFFDNGNEGAKRYREHLAMESLEEVIRWLTAGGKVGILDATNSTVERRRRLCERVAQERQLKVLFIESICTEGPVLDQNIAMKLNGPDYVNMPREEAIRDFKERIFNYEKVYETLDDEEEKRDVSYVKIINIGKKVITHNIHGYLQSHCVFYLMQLHIKKRTIWLTRHGESGRKKGGQVMVEYNIENRIGGDPGLTAQGKKYGQALGKFLANYYTNQADLPSPELRKMQELELTDDNFGTEGSELINVWTSTLRRTNETVESFDERIFDCKQIRFLNEIYAGNFENLTYEEMERLHPDDYTARSRNKLTYRYPGAGGESYLDVIERLRPIIIELERMETDTVICTHNVVMRTLVAYFLGLPLSQLPSLNVPLHTLYCLQPKPYGADLIKYKYNMNEDKFEIIE